MTLPGPRKAWFGATALVALTVVLEVLFPDVEHAELVWHRFPGFDFLFGFGGCALIIFAAKGVGKVLLQRPEDYYGDETR